MMQSQQIELFLSAAKYMNFSKAAEENFSSQPTVSRQIALLERELGMELFRRDKGAVVLTDAGAIIEQEFLRSKRSLSEAVKRAKNLQNQMTGDITIGYLSHLNTDMFVHPPTVDFSKRYPNVNVTLESGGFSALRGKLADGGYDVIFTYDFDIRAMENISYRKCYAVSHMFAMSSKHPLAQKDDLQLSDFSGQTFITQSHAESFGRDSDINSICEKFAITDVKIRTVNNIDSMMFAIRMEQGIAMLSSCMDSVFDSRYYCFPMPQIDVSTFVAAVWKMDNINPILPLYLNTLSESLNTDVFLDGGVRNVE